MSALACFLLLYSTMSYSLSYTNEQYAWEFVTYMHLLHTRAAPPNRLTIGAKTIAPNTLKARLTRGRSLLETVESFRPYQAASFETKITLPTAATAAVILVALDNFHQRYRALEKQPFVGAMFKIDAFLHTSIPATQVTGIEFNDAQQLAMRSFCKKFQAIRQVIISENIIVLRKV